MPSSKKVNRPERREGRHNTEKNGIKVMQKKEKGEGRYREEENAELRAAVPCRGALGVKTAGLWSSCLPVHPLSRRTKSHGMQSERRRRKRRGGFYLLRLTGRLSLFLRRQVLRWCCVYPRLAITALLTSGGLWKPFPLNLAPFWREMETRRRLREKDQSCDPTDLCADLSLWLLCV